MRRPDFHPQVTNQDYSNEIEETNYELRGFQEGL